MLRPRHRAAQSWRRACEGCSACIEGCPIERDVIAGGYEYNGNIDVRGTQPRLDVEAGEPRHVHVEDHAIGVPRPQRRDEIIAGAEGSDFVVSQPQQPPEHGAHRRLVVDDRDADGSAFHFAQVTAERIGG